MDVTINPPAKEFLEALRLAAQAQLELIRLLAHAAGPSIMLASSEEILGPTWVEGGKKEE